MTETTRSTYDERQAQRALDGVTLQQAVDHLRTRPAVPGSVEEAMIGVFERWARMGRLDPNMLARVGGPETIELARRVLAAAPSTWPTAAVRPAAAEEGE